MKRYIQNPCAEYVTIKTLLAAHVLKLPKVNPKDYTIEKLTDGNGKHMHDLERKNEFLQDVINLTKNHSIPRTISPSLHIDDCLTCRLI